MKPLTKEDLPVLAKIIRENTAYKVRVRNNKIFVRSIKELITVITIRCGFAFSSRKINGIPMIPYHYLFHRPDWLILI